MCRWCMRTKIVGVMLDKMLRWLNNFETSVYLFAINVMLLLAMYAVYMIMFTLI